MSLKPPVNPNTPLGTGRVVYNMVADYGARFDGTHDDTSVFQAAMTAVSAAGGGVVYCPVGTPRITGRITVPEDVTLWGAGNNLAGGGATEFLCYHANACIEFAGSGGLSGNFTVNGRTVATQCILRSVGAQRSFQSLEAVSALTNNIVVEQAQNDVWIRCGADEAGQDNLVLDRECGGQTFIGFESNQAGRHALLIEQSVASGGGYTVPTDITLIDCLFERSVGAYAVIKISAGSLITIGGGFVIDGNDGTVPLIDITGGANCSNIIIGDGAIAGSGSNPSAIRVSASSSTIIKGILGISGCSAVIDNSAGGTVRLLPGALRNSGISTTTAGTANHGDSNVVTETTQPTLITRGASGETVFLGMISGDAGSRWRDMSNGERRFKYDGSTFSYDSVIGPTAADQIGVATDDSFTIGTATGTGGSFLQMFEQSGDPSAPAANGARLFTKDNGAGKTQLCVRFNTGAVQVIATEP